MTRRLLAITCVLAFLIGGAGFQTAGAAYNPPTVVSTSLYIPIETPSTVDLSQFVSGGSGVYTWALELCDPVPNNAGSASLDANTGRLTVVPNDVFTTDGFGRVCYSVANTVPVTTHVRGSVTFYAIYPLQAGDGSFEVDPRNTLSGLLNPFVSGGLDADLFSLESPASHGTVVVNPTGDFEYQPDGGPSSQDSFIYRVTDDNGNTDVGLITIFLVYDTSVPSYGSVGSGGTGGGDRQSDDARSPGSTTPTEPADDDAPDDTGRGSDSCGRCN